MIKIVFIVVKSTKFLVITSIVMILKFIILFFNIIILTRTRLQEFDKK